MSFFFLSGVDDVEGLEVVLDVDAEAGPLLFLILLGNVRSLRRKVSNVANARLDHEIAAEDFLQGFGFRRGLDDH